MSEIFMKGQWADKVPVSTARSSLLGYGSMVAFVAAFGYWAATVPLAGAAISPGVIAAAGQNLKVQHLEGGTAIEVFVKEGDRVTKGQTLVKLDPTVPRAQLDRVVKFEVVQKTRALRLIAERDGLETFEAPQDLNQKAEAAGVAGIILEQQGEFNARLQRHKNELAILAERAAQLTEGVAGLEARRAASDKQLKIVSEETVRKLKLLDKGLTARDQYTQLLRSQADLLGQVSSAEAQIASTRNQINEAKAQISRSKSQRIEDAVRELSDAQSKISDNEEQIKAARAVLERTTIKAPADGVMVSLKVNSAGIVIRPGDAVYEMLPTSSDLVVDAKVDPQNIDSLRIGQDARLRFVALNATTTPEVPATVTYISADRLVDPATNQPYYQARLRITEELPEEITSEQIYPGMPVETYFSTGERTFFAYLIKPITDSFSRSFREK
jgi:HlyD family type I secretion membrane fusion protein